MNNVPTMNKKDQILMQLAHYFITVENYTPIVVKGIAHEIWLENIEAPYRIVRINTNYIHNNEQLDFDTFKVKNIVKQVKKKTLSFNINTLDILLDVGPNVNISNNKNINIVTIDTEKGLEKAKEINSLYPNLKNNLIKSNDEIEFLINVTTDINKKTEKENMDYINKFERKNISITYTLISLNILVYILCFVLYSFAHIDMYSRLALNRYFVSRGEIYRLITSAFTHQSIFHIFTNMYSLYIIGPQVENFIGKIKYILVYLISAIAGGLLSCIINPGWSIGASGAIFGLMGVLVYCGLHYRLYLGEALKTKILPLIGFNLAIGFIVPNIDVAAHIGGLVGGLFGTMSLGIGDKESKIDRINGTICLLIMLLFLSYLLFFR